MEFTDFAQGKIKVNGQEIDFSDGREVNIIRSFLIFSGCEDVEIVDKDIFFIDDGYQYSIHVDEIDKNWTATEIIKAAQLWSCCGVEVDRDIMICPKCKEHI